MKCYIFDSHKPINHFNVNSKKKIVIFDDFQSNLEECPDEDELQYFDID